MMSNHILEDNKLAQPFYYKNITSLLLNESKRYGQLMKREEIETIKKNSDITCIKIGNSQKSNSDIVINLEKKMPGYVDLCFTDDDLHNRKMFHETCLKKKIKENATHICSKKMGKFFRDNYTNSVKSRLYSKEPFPNYSVYGAFPKSNYDCLTTCSKSKEVYLNKSNFCRNYWRCIRTFKERGCKKRMTRDGMPVKALGKSIKGESYKVSKTINISMNQTQRNALRPALRDECSYPNDQNHLLITKSKKHKTNHNKEFGLDSYKVLPLELSVCNSRFSSTNEINLKARYVDEIIRNDLVRVTSGANEAGTTINISESTNYAEFCEQPAENCAKICNNYYSTNNNITYRHINRNTSQINMNHTEGNYLLSNEIRNMKYIEQFVHRQTNRLKAYRNNKLLTADNDLKIDQVIKNNDLSLGIGGNQHSKSNLCLRESSNRSLEVNASSRTNSMAQNFSLGSYQSGACRKCSLEVIFPVKACRESSMLFQISNTDGVCRKNVTGDELKLIYNKVQAFKSEEESLDKIKLKNKTANIIMKNSAAETNEQLSKIRLKSLNSVNVVNLSSEIIRKEDHERFSKQDLLSKLRIIFKSAEFKEEVLQIIESYLKNSYLKDNDFEVIVIPKKQLSNNNNNNKKPLDVLKETIEKQNKANLETEKILSELKDFNPRKFKGYTCKFNRNSNCCEEGFNNFLSRKIVLQPDSSNTVKVIERSSDNTSESPKQRSNLSKNCSLPVVGKNDLRNCSKVNILPKDDKSKKVLRINRKPNFSTSFKAYKSNYKRNRILPTVHNFENESTITNKKEEEENETEKGVEEGDEASEMSNNELSKMLLHKCDMLAGFGNHKQFENNVDSSQMLLLDVLYTYDPCGLLFCIEDTNTVVRPKSNKI